MACEARKQCSQLSTWDRTVFSIFWTLLLFFILQRARIPLSWYLPLSYVNLILKKKILELTLALTLKKMKG